MASSSADDGTGVHGFGALVHGTPAASTAVVGAKGSRLVEMGGHLGLPVPPGFVVSTAVCRLHLAGGWPDGLDEQIAAHVAVLEEAVGRRFGAEDDPLLLGVRASPPVEMPGVLPGTLDVGLDERSAHGLAETSGDAHFAFDSYRRLIVNLARTLHHVDPAPFDAVVATAMELAGVDSVAALPADLLRHVSRRCAEVYAQQTGEELPSDPMVQLRLTIAAVFDAWRSDAAVTYRNRGGIDHGTGVAVVVQAMVFGNRDDRSGTGVAYSHHPATGERRPTGDYLARAQGDDVVRGEHDRRPVTADGQTRRAPSAISARWRRSSRGPTPSCSTCSRWSVATTGTCATSSSPSSRAGCGCCAPAPPAVPARRRSASRWSSSRTPRCGSRGPRRSVASAPSTSSRCCTRRSSRPVTTCSPVASAPRRVPPSGRSSSPPTPPWPPRRRVDPSSSSGPRPHPRTCTGCRWPPASSPHGAVWPVTPPWWPGDGGRRRCAVPSRSASCRVGFAVGPVTVTEGDVISIDGSSGEVMVGAVTTAAVEPPAELDVVLGWADTIRAGHLAVRANADTAADATRAREFGAEGIGLCRTEHMFLGEDRLPVVRQMILATSPAAERTAMARLRMVQRQDFIAVLAAMDGLPVTVRLLDPPLHEFLPDLVELEVRERTVGLGDDERQLLEAARRWSETNPMIGTRGVRLGYLKPGLYQMQVRALVEAVAERRAAGGNPIVEIMIPLTVTAAELAGARAWVTDVLASEGVDAGGSEITVGTMIETPRAALRAGELAAHADFFSLGTNDLTQLTFGFSRDDVEGRIVPLYLDLGLLDGNPFETIDGAGVGELVELAVTRGRAARPGLKVGVCGEHGGDAASIAVFHAAGVDYVSCSPYRVPVARLAAAHAVLASR